MEEKGISLPEGIMPCCGVDSVKKMLLQLIQQGKWRSGTEMDLDTCMEWCRERMLTLYGTVVKPMPEAQAFVGVNKIGDFLLCGDLVKGILGNEVAG